MGILDLRIHLPDLRPAPRVAQVHGRDVPEGVAPLHHIFGRGGGAQDHGALDPLGGVRRGRAGAPRSAAGDRGFRDRGGSGGPRGRAPRGGGGGPSGVRRGRTAQRGAGSEQGGGYREAGPGQRAPEAKYLFGNHHPLLATGGTRGLRCYTAQTDAGVPAEPWRPAMVRGIRPSGRVPHRNKFNRHRTLAKLLRRIHEEP